MRINAIHAHAYSSLESLPELDPAQARAILSLILGYACASGHFGSIFAGRKAYHRIPSEWRREMTRAIAESSLDITDDYEYRRLLELLQETDAALLAEFKARGATSPDPDIRQASEDY